MSRLRTVASDTAYLCHQKYLSQTQTLFVWNARYFYVGRGDLSNSYALFYLSDVFHSQVWLPR